MNEERLIEIKNELDELKTKVSRLEGKQQSLMETLNEKFGCKSIKEADTMLNKLSAQIDDLEEQIDTQLQELEELYDANEQQNEDY